MQVLIFLRFSFLFTDTSKWADIIFYAWAGFSSYLENSLNFSQSNSSRYSQSIHFGNQCKLSSLLGFHLCLNHKFLEINASSHLSWVLISIHWYFQMGLSYFLWRSWVFFLSWNLENILHFYLFYWYKGSTFLSLSDLLFLFTVTCKWVDLTF